MAERSQAPERELRSKVVGSIPGHPNNVSIPDCKKISIATTFRIILQNSSHPGFSAQQSASVVFELSFIYNSTFLIF